MSCYFCFTVNGNESFYQACLTMNGYLIGGASGRGKTKAEAEEQARIAYRAMRLKEKASRLIITD